MAVYDRASELRAFDDAKTGVKGLVDAGATKIPRIFIHPPSHDINITTINNSKKSIPVIDLSNPHRPGLVRELGSAAETFGIFQVVGHGIPRDVLDEMLRGVRRFHEQDEGVKKEYYSRDSTRKVVFNTNFDFYQSPAANWRDTLTCIMAPEPPTPEELPPACREIIIEYVNHIQRLGGIIFELLSESLGLKPEHLKEMECSKGLFLVGHYYPSCPEPHLTLGTTKHSDNDFLTILLQDHNIGGLQVLHEDQWIDVHPRPGALVVNIGDLLQDQEEKLVAGEKNPLPQLWRLRDRVVFDVPFVMELVKVRRKDYWDHGVGTIKEDLLSPMTSSRAFNIEFLQTRLALEFQWQAFSRRDYFHHQGSTALSRSCYLMKTPLYTRRLRRGSLLHITSLKDSMDDLH